MAAIVWTALTNRGAPFASLAFMSNATHEMLTGATAVRMGAVHRLALALVWITFASSAVVFSEPAPVDILMLAIIGVLPILGLVRITPPLLAFFTVWLVAAACALVGTINAANLKTSLVHATVTLFLSLGAFVIAGFVMRRPLQHTNLILQAYAFSALIAALAGMVGYFNLFPGAFEIFTLYGRASGTFKDPNVYGPFLVPPIVYFLHRMLTRGAATLPWTGLCALVLTFGVLISFSRGAWFVLASSIAIFGYLAFVTAASHLQRLKIVGAACMAATMALVVVVAALQIDSVADQLSNRANLDQSYDQGPEGRFGGHEKAKRLIVLNPLGIGPQQFSPQFHLEEPHNVYLAMFLNAGWLGGLIFAIMVFLTCLYGLRHAFKRTAAQPLFIVAYACFVAHALEGFIIDLDHWRHFHVLMAIVWGLMLGDRQIVRRLATFDPRHVFRRPEMLVASRPPRQLVATAPVRETFIRRVPAARRDAGRGDSRPSRAQGRTFARQIP
jgi:O-antigen ligase